MLDGLYRYAMTHGLSNSFASAHDVVLFLPTYTGLPEAVEEATHQNI